MGSNVGFKMIFIWNSSKINFMFRRYKKCRRSKFSYWYLDTGCPENRGSMFLRTHRWPLTGLKFTVTAEGYCVMYTDSCSRNFRRTLQNLYGHKVP